MQDSMTDMSQEAAHEWSKKAISIKTGSFIVVEGVYKSVLGIGSW